MLPALLRAAALALAAGAALSQTCASQAGCAACTTINVSFSQPLPSCQWCQAPSADASSGRCVPYTGVACTSPASAASFLSAAACPALTSCGTTPSLTASCAACAGSVSPICSWISPASSDPGGSGNCVAFGASVIQPLGWFRYDYSYTCSASSSALAGGIIAAIVIACLLLIVLPIIILVLVCACGISVCCFAGRRGTVVMVPQQAAQAQARAAYPGAYAGGAYAVSAPAAAAGVAPASLKMYSSPIAGGGQRTAV